MQRIWEAVRVSVRKRIRRMDRNWSGSASVRGFHADYSHGVLRIHPFLVQLREMYVDGLMHISST